MGHARSSVGQTLDIIKHFGKVLPLGLVISSALSPFKAGNHSYRSRRNLLGQKEPPTANRKCYIIM